MNYSRFQKFTSSFLIFALLFSITFRVPFFDFHTFAGSKDFYNIVSIIVDEKSYSDIKSELNRYAKDIQGVLDNTKVVILPTPVNTQAFNIASLNESLYNEGYKSIDKGTDFESKLIGTVIVGDFELPTVYDKGVYSRTILPFTDFEDKVYIYNHQTNRYEKNKENNGGLKSEIWHGVITPNLGSYDKNIEGLKEYFDKNHDYYSGTGNFKYSDGILNGNETVGVPSVYEPYVFYYDQLREEKSLNYNSYQAYLAYLENKEDIVYSRYTKDLSNKIVEKSSKVANKTVGELLDKLGDEKIKSYIGNNPDTSRVPDVQTRFIVENVTKKFIEIFAKGTMGDFRKDVHNAGRYNKTNSNINVDMIPYLVTVLDLVNDEIRKDVNNEIEKQIDDLVKNGLSRNIALPTRVTNSDGCGTTYQNYLYGQKTENITKASQCSIYLGSTNNGGSLVEANRGLNINNANPDKDTLYNDPKRDYCFQNLQSGAALNGYWGRNSPLNLNIDNIINADLVLKAHDYKGAIYPLFDVSGSKKTTDNTLTPSPLNCLDNNYILAQTHDRDGDGNCYVNYQIPTFGGRVNWSCTTDNNAGKTYGYTKKFEDNYKKPNGNISLNGSTVVNASSNLTFSYKKIPSILEHKSPTSDELTKEINAQATTSLPVDRDRYVDFINSKGDYTKIDYPSLFRLKLEDNSKVTPETVSEQLDKLLDEKSKEINKIITTGNPDTLSGKEKSIYDLLKTGTYPSANFSLKDILTNKPSKTFTVDGESKTLSYYDTLVFSIYWNNLNSVSAKYGFIFDNYLVDQFGDDSKKYFLPKNKKEYEISYLGAGGNAQSMYIKMDPEGKATNPYADIYSKNIELSSMFYGSNVGEDSSSSGGDQKSTFKCAPPDGVPIWSWIPAIMCRLGDMLPPTISISEGSCGVNLLSGESSGYDDMFLSNEEKEEIRKCNGDVDKNGINDCIETKLVDGNLVLSSDSEKYYYYKNAILKAEIQDKTGKVVKLDNTSSIYFDIVKLEVQKDPKKELSGDNIDVIYDQSITGKTDASVISKYVSLKPTLVRSTQGVATYGLTLKTKDANVYLKSTLKEKDSSGVDKIFLSSNTLEVKVRGDRLFSTSYRLTNGSNGIEADSTRSTLVASDKTNLYLVDGTINNIKDISNTLFNNSSSKEKFALYLQNLDKNSIRTELNYPLKVTLYNNKIKLEEYELVYNDIKLFKGLTALKKSGAYTLEIIDSKGFKTNKKFEVLPDVPDKVDINLGTNVLESGGALTTNFATIYDKYLNPVSGNFYDLDFSLSGGSLVFSETNKDTMTSSTYEGYKIFRLKSTEKTGENVLKLKILDMDGKEILSTTKSLYVNDGISLVARPISGDIKVGGGKYKFEVSLRDKNGQILSNFNSRVYMTASKIYLEPINPYFELKNGVAEVEFKTKTVAGKDIPIEFQVEGLKSIVQKTVTVYPEKAMKMDLILSNSKIEASPTSYATLDVELKDRYNNLVFNDSTTESNLEILDNYSNIIKSDKINDKFKEGVSKYKLYGTVNPGVAYFKVSANPSLSQNTYVINKGDGDITINGVGENAGKIETFYFWNESKLDGKKYNSIYTTLLGSNYGDIYEQDYLAGSLLFDKSNRSLAVTSVLNNPYYFNNILDINNNGGLKTLYSDNDLSQDIDISPIFINNKLGLNLYNKALNIYIGKLFYNFSNDTKLSACEGNLDTCFDKKKTTISIKTKSDKYKVYFSDNKLLFRDLYGKTIFEIYQDGTINRFGNFDIEFNKSVNSKYLSLNIKLGGQTIGELGYNFINPVISTSKDENIFESKMDNTNNSILLLLKTSSYSTYNNGNNSSQSKIIYYNDPFGADKRLNSFSKENPYGVENFANKAGIGWNDGNKALLSFSAGKSVGESVKDYMSFSVINLGDPVISLKKIKQKFNDSNTEKKFDSTIGKLISNDDNISSYQIFDYNNDSRDDILLIKDDKTLKLLENKNINERFQDMGNLAYLADLGSTDLIKTGDFTGDGFDDIFFVSKDGKPFLLNNVEKNFSRNSLETNFKLAGRIVRAEKFDMDNDGKEDIVILDDFGELSIFYGGGTKINPTFTKKLISGDHGITLDTNPRNDGGLVYFDGLYQPAEVNNKNAKIDNYLFVKYPYGIEQLDNTGAYISGNETLPDSKSSKYFIKSEYSADMGVNVEKRYVDKNGKFISSNDIVEVEVILKNVANKDLKNLVFAEKVPEVFKLDKSSFESESDFDIYDGQGSYTYHIDNFNLPIDGTLRYTYKVKVQPLKFDNIEVGLFEKGEAGDDKYGDIIIKPDNKNCSESVDLYRSTEVRTYQKGFQAPVCDQNKVKLPEEIEKNTFDSDGNGVPDYIDLLTKPNNPKDLQDYSKKNLKEITKDTDKDGVPDNEDYFEMDGGITVDLSVAGKKVDSALDDLENIMNSLNCGFGGEGCIATPLNWAPLAPGSDPVFMGKTIGDGLIVDEGLPLFSMFTWQQVGPVCVPTVWPVSVSSTGCSGKGAGGRLGIDNPTNFLRIFLTPTLTGGMGTAICFGGPASVAGVTIPEAVAPLTPGGNCIVIAKKTFGCSQDGSEGDPGSTGFPSYSNDGSYGVINGNCSDDPTSGNELSQEKITSYLNKAKKGPVEAAFDFLPGDFSSTKSRPLFSRSQNSSAKVSIDLEALANGDFEDVVQIQQRRVSPFPSWFMDWVTRQIEEIANKLTDFPTLFVILPDFTGVLDGNWGEASGNKVKNGANPMIGNSMQTGNETIDNYSKKVNSGIKEAYEFLGSLPLVYLDQETVNITLPWISDAELDRAIIARENTLGQRENEIARASEAWTLGGACQFTDPVQQQECETQNGLGGKVSAQFLGDAGNMVNSLRDNIEVLRSYKQIPQKINNLITKKQAYLQQILCNVDTISYVLGGRIGQNGIRFKAWVELYILIKSVLKSWQAIVDVFLDYEQECHDCKNERQDALEQEFSLVDMIVPKIPVIRFPKWPDIILDLHNIRAGLRVTLPEYNINSKPIILPSLPPLQLPKVPNANVSLSVNLPALPVLPSIDIPTLPDLPTLPRIELPDLPPPPKLPKLLSSISIVVDIAKLITKALCILKSSPLHPEWRAGDQIAFLTERTGYLGYDFFEGTMPEFSFPSVDAIKVTSYVNLEFEANFIVELARQIALPINAFTNDFTNIFDVGIGDMNFKDVVPKGSTPSNINIEASPDGVDNNFGYNQKDKNNIPLILAKRISDDFVYLMNYIDKNKEETVDNNEFKQLVTKSLSSKTVTSDPKLDNLRQIWTNVGNMTYSKEDKLISDLQENNRKKFETLSDIINTELESTKKLKNKLTNYQNKTLLKDVASENTNKIEVYNSMLSKYNEKFIQSAKNLMDGKGDGIKQDLEEESKVLMDSIRTPLKEYSDSRKTSNNNDLLSINTKKANNLLAVETNTQYNYANANSNGVNSCQAGAKSPYRYVYKGLYILEGNKSYRLFDYIDELTGNEVTKSVDIDKDNDEDLFYIVNGQLYLKENLENKYTKKHVSTNPIVLDSEDNKFYNGDTFYEAVNNANEISRANGTTVVNFSAPTNTSINNFRLGFYDLVDKYTNLTNNEYKPEYVRKDIVDALANIDNTTIESTNELYTIRKNIVNINTVGNLKGVKLKTKELINIKTDLEANNVVNLSSGKKLYAGGSSFTIKYIEFNSNDSPEKQLSVGANQNIEFDKPISIVGLSGNAYINTDKDIYIEGVAIRTYLDKPLLPESSISYLGDNYENLNQSYVELKYYDGSELNINFSENKSWELYDLGYKSKDYYIRLDRSNDFYYAKINSFKENIDSTLSNQILLSPQIQADQSAPGFKLQSIKVPVYKKKVIDFTPNIYEDSGIKNISKVIIDMDLATDTDGDGNNKNDQDGKIDGAYFGKIKILKNSTSIKAEFGEFDKLFKQKIGVTLIDANNNVGYKEVNLEVYSPKPNISKFDSGVVKGNLSEKLDEIPVNLYKFRGGVISSLQNTTGNIKTNTIDNGLYLFNAGSGTTTKTGLNLYKNGLVLANIEEKTGKIAYTDSTLSTRVLSSNNTQNDNIFPKIILSESGKDIFYEYVQVEGVNKVSMVDSFDNIKEKGIYLMITDTANYSYYQIPENIDYNPGAVSIYRLADSTKKELFTIFNDARVNTLNEFYELQYVANEKNWYYKLVDTRFNREIARLSLVTDSDYILK